MVVEEKYDQYIIFKDRRNKSTAWIINQQEYMRIKDEVIYIFFQFF